MSKTKPILGRSVLKIGRTEYECLGLAAELYMGGTGSCFTAQIVPSKRQAAAFWRQLKRIAEHMFEVQYGQSRFKFIGSIRSATSELSGYVTVSIAVNSAILSA